MSVQTIAWIVFAIVIIVMLGLDLGLFTRKQKDPSFKTAVRWVFTWVGVALGFNIFVYFEYGHTRAAEFLAGYLIEQSLSIDNIFVFLMIFTFFKVPSEYQRRVLIYGILGAIVTRGIMILGATALIARFQWMLYVLGAVLILTGFKMWFSKGVEFNAEKNIFFILVRKMFRITTEYDGNRFFTMKDNKLWATPLFMVLVVIEGTDVVFAVDSIPAILAISRDQFILFTSNIFAILGLRSLYFVVHGMMKMFHHLHYGLSLILVGIGTKMIVQELYDLHVTPLITLGFITTTLVVCIVTSLKFPETDEPAVPPQT